MSAKTKNKHSCEKKASYDEVVAGGLTTLQSKTV